MPEITAKQAIVVDYQTGFVMFERNADERMQPSSMSKIMTAYMVFEAIKNKQIALDDMLPVSERAWRMQGSKLFVPLNGRVKVEDLIKGMIIQSGNDACIVLAEALNKLERTSPFASGLTAHDRVVDGLKAIAWASLALGAGGAVVGASGAGAGAGVIITPSHRQPGIRVVGVESNSSSPTRSNGPPDEGGNHGSSELIRRDPTAHLMREAIMAHQSSSDEIQRPT